MPTSRPDSSSQRHGGTQQKTPLNHLCSYSLKLEDALRRYVTDGRLEIDNNRAERALRQVAVGRKNWMFFLTEGGGESAAVLLSLVMTAKAIGLDPQNYLRDEDVFWGRP